MRKNIFLLLLLLLLIIIPFLLTNDYFVYVITIIFIYSIAAIGLNVLTGLTNQISLGHAGFFAVGAYSVGIYSKFLQIGFFLSFILTLITAVVFGFLIALPTLRLRGLYLAIITLAFGLVIERVAYFWTPVTGGANGIVIDSPSIFGFSIDIDLRLYYFVLFFLVILSLLYFNIYRSVIGKRFVAINNSEIASSSVGIYPRDYKILAFIVSAIFGATSGSLYGVTLGFITVDHFDFFLSVSFLAMIIIGGLGSKYGPYLGAAFIVLLPEMLRGLDEYYYLAYGLSIVIIFMFWRTGLAGIFTSIKNVLIKSQKKAT